MEQENMLGLTTWMRMVIEGESLEPFVEYLMGRASNDEKDVSALMDLSLIAQLQGQVQWGIALQLEALKQQQVYQVGGVGQSNSLKVLGIMMPGVINDSTIIETLLAPFDITLTLAYVGEDVPWMGQLPEHQVLVNCIANRSDFTSYLSGISDLFDGWAFPVINRPSKILKLVPENLGATLSSLANVCYANSDDLNVDNIQVLNGLLPVYRIFIIGNAFYLHSVALHDNAQTLKHGYFEGDMLANIDKQALEAKLFETFMEQFCVEYQTPLAQLSAALEVEYVSVDCIPLKDNQLAITAVDTATLVHNIEGVGSANHTKAHNAIVQAFHNLLLKSTTR